MSRCRFAGLDPEDDFAPRPRLLPTHLDGCNSAGCLGCQPCPERHCEATGCPGRHLTPTERICPTCIGHVRANLDGIVNMTTRLLTEAVHRGVNSEAAMLDGPKADVADWERRHRLVANGLACECVDECPDVPPRYGPHCEGKCQHDSCAWRRGRPDCPVASAWHADNRSEPHPGYVLADWDAQICEHLGHSRTMIPTLESAAGYIGGQLTHLARDSDFDFDGLAREIRGCHGHLEDVLREGERAEKGAPCPSCGGPALVKEWGVTEAFDMWTCPSGACHQVWTEAEYRTMIDGIYVEIAEALTAKQIEAKYRIPAGSVRSWASKGAVETRGKREGVTLYDVAQCRAMRDKSA